VSARTVQIGQIIASGINNVGGGTAMLTISDLSHIFVLASVDESDIGGVELDQKVLITADAFPGKRFFGKVVRIAAKGVNVSNVVTFEVRVEVMSDDKALLKPEMTANVEIVVAEKEDVLTLPTRAVVRKAGKTFVALKQADGSIKEDVPVTIGLSSGNDVEVQDGVQENDSVVFKKNDSDSRWKAQTQGARPPMMMMGTPPGLRGGGRR
jgi:HlyD family secretion protein